LYIKTFLKKYLENYPYMMSAVDYHTVLKIVLTRFPGKEPDTRCMLLNCQAKMGLRETPYRGDVPGSSWWACSASSPLPPWPEPLPCHKGTT
jgi:hypothetical protein